ncbi:hypothetical protein V5P93_003631 [Actinokineospora auranticolor]|uniref:Papain fold toxin 1 (Glutamine deamidase) of polymorphic toxin system n=1 Tax=Actinokineospora auranticolor TaxID=155976 RepID=A0A2S6GIY7_9PSEU|nr:hypothetical protein [Actinokineospora auranticolor]PPK65194.1 hypothetical protein CLV40_11541 [Actinokineospora auranticolor]
MRFSNSNSFYGDPVADVEPYRDLVLANVTDLGQFAGGQPVVFTWDNPTKHQIEYVEVTRADYEALTAEMEVEPPAPATNTYGLDDNCYYVTAAALLDTTVGALITTTETMQIRGGASEGEITSLFRAAGLRATPTTLTTYTALVAEMRRVAAGSHRRFAVAFGRADGSGHAVVGEVMGADTGEVRFRDHQVTEGADATTDVSAGVLFVLYPQ